MLTRRRRLALPLLLAAALLGAAGGVSAASKTLDFTASATVVAVCRVTADPVGFGILAPGMATAQTDATGAVRVSCTSGVAYAVALDLGDNTTGLFGRRMRHQTLPTNYLSYELYSDAARSTPWRDNYFGLFSTWDVNATSTGATTVHTVYARLPVGQTPPAGAYLDTVTATVTY